MKKKGKNIRAICFSSKGNPLRGGVVQNRGFSKMHWRRSIFKCTYSNFTIHTEVSVELAKLRVGGKHFVRNSQL